MWHPKKIQLSAMLGVLKAGRADGPATGAFVRYWHDVVRTTGELPVVNITDDLAQKETVLLPAVSSPHLPHLPQTDKIDLRDLTLPRALTDSLSLYIQQHRTLPDAIRLHTWSAYKLAGTGLCAEGYFKYYDGCQVSYILIIPDDSLDYAAICLDRYPRRQAS